MGSASSSKNNGSLSSENGLPFIRRFRSAEPPPIAQTSNGPVEGKRLRITGTSEPNKYVNVFLGIPFAKPPIGELRFKKPEPLDVTWSAPLPAKRYKSRAIQKDFVWDRMELMVGKSEDCLYLNVIAPGWQPDPNTFPKGFAVMVYIHGGGFVIDSAVKYDYTRIARTLVRHDVVVVTIQYRLGFLGYFSTGDDNCPGNCGLWDQLMALKWVKNNIANFGGNPENITVFGQSAGAASTDLLSISPLSRDLFQQVILMGGSAETIWAVSSKELLIEYCRQKALSLGFQRTGQSAEWSPEENSDLMKFLRSLPAAKFEMTMIGDRIIIEEMRVPLTPIIDGEILPKSISELRKEAPPIRAMAGVTKHEGLLFLALGFQRTNTKFLTYCEQRASELLEKSKERGNVNEVIQMPLTDTITMATFRDLYGLTDLMRKDKKAVQYACVTIMSDLINNLSLQNYCDKMSQYTKSTVYRYIFEHFNPSSSRALNPLLPFIGATHCTELIYIFDINVFVTPWRRNSADRRVLDLTTRMWTNFAKFGDPNGRKCDNNNNEIPNVNDKNARNMDFCWEPVSEDSLERHLVINEKPRMCENLESKRIERLAPSLEYLLQ
ncbi:carboxylesterase family domain-containing protein [Ditylenchus destructor]|uniref:Carboxylic ester hydrolase n=1 Tax=Ditylenchus destructor TaxID=166010 RepID=A0AAD4R4S2_9BILA|nr:carboxylesterase family domain-containing protein [Ditylenchus destructor]